MKYGPYLAKFLLICYCRILQLESFYENKDKDIIESINKLPEPDKSANTNDTDDYSEKVNLQHILNNFFESVPDDNELVKALGGRIDKAKHYIDFMDRLIEQRLPKVLPKFKDVSHFCWYIMTFI